MQRVLLALCLCATLAHAQSDSMSRAQVTGIIAAYRKIVTPNGVDERRALEINGSTQWVSIRGRDMHNPVLLFLHGGPGSPTMPAAYTFQSPWEDYFTVVQWDQRGAGKTFAANDSAALAPTMTLAQMTSDAEAVVQYLQHRFGQPKIFVLGHSWGTILGVNLARRHPEWLYAYLGVGQVVNAQRSESEGYQFALAEARAHKNTEAERDLEALAPYPGSGPMTIARIGTQRKWLNFYGGLTYGRTDFSYDANAWNLSPDYSDKELAAIDAGGLYSLGHLLPTLMATSFDADTVFKCPIVLFIGRHDYATSHTLAAAWFSHIHAPDKKFVWFESSSHMVMQEEPGRFLYHLIVDLRPMAQDRR